jgi:hypothetical protein
MPTESTLPSSLKPSDDDLAAAVRHTLDWIDKVPSELPLPAMPGFDRDWVESLLIGNLQPEDEPITLSDALSMALEWVDAIPRSMMDELPPFTRPATASPL